MCSTAVAVSSFFASEQANNAAEARIYNNNFFMFLNFRCINDYLVAGAGGAGAAATSSKIFLVSTISICEIILSPSHLSQI